MRAIDELIQEHHGIRTVGGRANRQGAHEQLHAVLEQMLALYLR